MSRLVRKKQQSRNSLGGPIGPLLIHEWQHVSSRRSLTDHVQLHEEAPDGLRADLALVPARVPPPRLLDLQHPLVPRRVVVGLVARVRRVREPTHGEDVQVAVPDPRHLQKGACSKLENIFLVFM